VSPDRSYRRNRVYLPLFWDLTDRWVLVVGGGLAGWQKVRALAPSGVPLVVVSPQVHPDLETWASEPSHSVVLHRRPWAPADLGGSVGLVLACTADLEVNAAVVAACRSRGLPVLDAAQPDAGDFIQPATHRCGDFTMAISSGGTVPRGAVALRDAVAPAFDAAVAGLPPTGGRLAPTAGERD